MVHFGGKGVEFSGSAKDQIEILLRMLRREIRTGQEEKQIGSDMKIKMYHGLCYRKLNVTMDGSIQNGKNWGTCVFSIGFLFLFSVLICFYCLNIS